jgi:hypothetical protein
MNDPTTPKAPTKPKLSVTINTELLDEVDALVQQHRPFVRRHAVHLAALRLGLAELRAHPARLVELLAVEHERRSVEA